MTGLRRAILVVSAVAILAGCRTASPATFPNRGPDAIGTLSSLVDEPSPADAPLSATYRLTVESPELSYYTDASITITADTVIADETGESLMIDAIEPDVVVEIWVDSCRESFPVQCDATHVRLTSGD